MGVADNGFAVVVDIAAAMDGWHQRAADVALTCPAIGVMGCILRMEGTSGAFPMHA